MFDCFRGSPNRDAESLEESEEPCISGALMEVSEQLRAPPQRDAMVGGIATLLLLVGMPIGWLSGNTSTGDAIGFVVATAISVALMAGIFFWLLPRERAAGRTARTSLILAIVALVLIVVFWTGLCFAVGAGAVALGLTGRASAAGGQGKATVAVGLGALVIVAAFVGLLTG
jgi:hypothetical protein